MVDLLTFKQLEKYQSLINSSLFRYIEKYYAGTQGFDRYPFQYAVLDEIKKHDKFIARLSVGMRKGAYIAFDLVYRIRRNYTIEVVTETYSSGNLNKEYYARLAHEILPVITDWLENISLRDSKRRCTTRAALLKEEIAAAAWAPKRVERWIAAGGPDILDAL